MITEKFASSNRQGNGYIEFGQRRGYLSKIKRQSGTCIGLGDCPIRAEASDNSKGSTTFYSIIEMIHFLKHTHPE